jgi:hypothetical protein
VVPAVGTEDATVQNALCRDVPRREHTYIRDVSLHCERGEKRASPQSRREKQARRCWQKGDKKHRIKSIAFKDDRRKLRGSRQQMPYSRQETADRRQ